MIVSFEDYVPTPRYDNTPWTTVKVYESELETGPFNLIDTIVINPVDADPTHPSPRSFTTENATLTSGWYRVDFIDAASNVLPTDPIQNAVRLDSEYLPTLRQVGLVTMGRTLDSNGNYAGTFTADTNPTDTDVIGVINLAGDDVRDKIGGVIPPDLREKAQRVIALRAAMLIELSFFPSEVATDRSPYTRLKELYDELLPDLVQAVESEEQGDNVDDPVGGAGRYAEYGFDNESSWMTRKM